VSAALVGRGDLRDGLRSSFDFLTRATRSRPSARTASSGWTPARGTARRDLDAFAWLAHAAERIAERAGAPKTSAAPLDERRRAERSRQKVRLRVLRRAGVRFIMPVSVFIMPVSVFIMPVSIGIVAAGAGAGAIAAPVLSRAGGVLGAASGENEHRGDQGKALHLTIS
jgi:hypothetical protein